MAAIETTKAIIDITNIAIKNWYIPFTPGGGFPQALPGWKD